MSRFKVGDIVKWKDSMFKLLESSDKPYYGLCINGNGMIPYETVERQTELPTTNTITNRSNTNAD